jgi:hypothetical protein
VTREFGSRYALAKASCIPASTLQSYEAGSKPGMDALATLARVANVDINWLLSGKGEMRPAGLLPGAVLADVLMVDEYELGASLAAEMVIRQIPFSRSFLQTPLGLKNPAPERLLMVEAGSNLFEIDRGDLVLVDRTQTNLGRDGIYLIDLPGIELRGIFRQPNGTVRVIGPNDQGRRSRSERDGYDRREGASGEVVMKLEQFVLSGRRTKVVGRAVWISRAL